MLLPGAELQLLSQVPSPPHSTGLIRLSGGVCVWLEPCRGSSAACKSHVGKSSPWPRVIVQFLGEGLRVRHTQQPGLLPNGPREAGECWALHGGGLAAWEGQDYLIVCTLALSKR